MSTLEDHDARSATSIAIAIVERDGCFLIGQRPTGKSLAGYWEFPGGRVEAGETAAEAAVRECREETGLEVEVVDHYDDHEQAYEHDRVHLQFFACREVTIDREPASPFRWVPLQGLGGYKFPAGNACVLQTLLMND